MAIEKIAIKDLERETLQTRVALSADTVEDYADAMRGKAKFPPVTVFADAERDTLWLADGFHRVAAAEADGYKFVKAEVIPGTFADALKFALGANANHGLRRSNADKRHTLEMAWENRRELFGANDPTAENLVETCGISLGMVTRFIADRAEELTPKRVSSSGRIHTVPKRPLPTARKVSQRETFHTRESISMRDFAKSETTENGDETGENAPKPKNAPIRPIAAAKTAPQNPSRPPAYDHAAGVGTDRFGVEIPMQIRGAFKAETVRDEIETHLRAAANLLKRAMDEKDPSVAQFRQADLIDLQNAVRTAKFTKPYCVCRICQGNGRGSCSACHETGFQTQAQYENNPKEFKA